MKNIIWFISLSLLFLFGIRAVNVTSLSGEERTVCVFQEDIPVDQLCSFPSRLPDSDKAFVDAGAFAGQLRALGRCQRQQSVTYSLLSKELVCRMLKSYLNALLQSANYAYTSLPRPCWTVSSEHYVFGMRRILI